MKKAYLISRVNKAIVGLCQKEVAEMQNYVSSITVSHSVFAKEIKH